ncbi:hypothetical protein B0T14DRAFT_528907 [Immersiella caudata]|uniref:RING-type domain-containing protein n=1 Tax=Immersiella caudata TaxID=314043 RepID=A0AA39WFY9_9PEZI|nr:hypothetical protein B0T14DRAFT_528907 [Immersiella caudata]
MRKLMGKLRLRKPQKSGPTEQTDWSWHKDELDPKYVVPNPPGPLPAPTPNPGPDNRGLRRDFKAAEPKDDVGTFSGFGSWLASFEPDPHGRGVVEVEAQGEGVVSETISLENGWPHEHGMIRVRLEGLKKPDTSTRSTVIIIGPWFMTLAQVNRLLVDHGYTAMLSAKHGTLASVDWDGDGALPRDLQIPIVDSPSRYDFPDGEGPLLCKSEQVGAFMQNLRRLRVCCSSEDDGKVLITSFPARLEIGFNRTLRLPEDGKTHNQPVRLGKIPVNNIASLSKKLEASGSQSLVGMARKGGIFFPLYQREAMFLSFKAHQDAFAVRVFAGGVNAVSGLPWSSHPGYKIAMQDYLSVPPQRYLDGVCVAKDVVKQFVAMPLGSGYSVEKQVTGKETVGGMQLEIIPGNRWVLQVPASPNLPQPGPYFPDPDQKAGSLGVQMTVLGGNPYAGPKVTREYNYDAEDEAPRPVYLWHLYRSQTQHPYQHQPQHPLASGPTDFYPGMHITMRAVYMLSLALQFEGSVPSWTRTEKVEWAPWWTLERSFSEYQRVSPKDNAAESLNTLEFYHRGRRLYAGGVLTLQGQGVADGDILVVRKMKIPRYGYPSYPPERQQQAYPQPQHYGGYQDQPQGQAPQYHDASPSSQLSTAYGSSYGYQQSPVELTSGYSSANLSPAQQYSYASSPQQSADAQPTSPSSMHSVYDAAQEVHQGQSVMPTGPSSFAQSPGKVPYAEYSVPPPPRSSSVPEWNEYRHSLSESNITLDAMPDDHYGSPAARIHAAPTTSAAGSSPASPRMPSRVLGAAPRQPKQQQDQTGWAMGLAAGSKIRQAIFPDPFVPTTWCKPRATILSVQILNSVAFESLTGMLAPASPITPQMYLEHGLPFLTSYDEGVTTDGTTYLAGIKGVGEIDAMQGPVQLSSNAAGRKSTGCTCCGKMLCDSILRPCNHAFCSSCISQYMTHRCGADGFFTICRICNTRATNLIGFSAPMALPGEDVVDLSNAKVITIEPQPGIGGFHSIHELSAVPDEGNQGHSGVYELQT